MGHARNFGYAVNIVWILVSIAFLPLSLIWIWLPILFLYILHKGGQVATMKKDLHYLAEKEKDKEFTN